MAAFLQLQVRLSVYDYGSNLDGSTVVGPAEGTSFRCLTRRIDSSNSRLLSSIYNFTAQEPPELDRQLGVYRQYDDPDVRILVAEYLSHALETEPGPIAAAVQVDVDKELPPEIRDPLFDHNTYAEHVEEALANVRSAQTWSAGRPFELDLLVDDLLRHAYEGEDSMRTNDEHMVFEATTGHACGSWFSDEPAPRVLPLQLAASIEAYRESRPTTFAVGHRYFFGRPLPL